MCSPSISSVLYHNFLHGAASYTLNHSMGEIFTSRENRVPNIVSLSVINRIYDGVEAET